ncbi:GNAT family N-acetyltransferase [Tabrizicola sp.]|uniref:GNAT family N-acetyltransferase n=1 Tax=Tabrizicola sp. TaxID=2005166 RepID=UPI003F4177FF
MVAGPDFSRELRSGEEAEVDALLRAAFPGPQETRLVHQLRDDGNMVHELVLPWDNRIGAYAGISRMVEPKNWFCLAPVAVRPDLQNGAAAPAEAIRNSFRFGSRLVRLIVTAYSQQSIREGLAKGGWLEGDEPLTLVVLGKPSFYARCGFSLERAARLTTPYPVKNTLIARPGHDVPEETLIYPPAFDGV